jgi:hypothetical protein
MEAPATALEQLRMRLKEPQFIAKSPDMVCRGNAPTFILQDGLKTVGLHVSTSTAAAAYTYICACNLQDRNKTPVTHFTAN